MRTRKTVSILLIIIILFQLILPVGNSIAATNTLSGTIDITAANGRGGIKLNWPLEASTDKVFKVYQRKDDESSTWQSISTVDFTSNTEKVRVLNVYPLATGNHETPVTGAYIMQNFNSYYGKGIITVDCVPVVDFNANPYRYLTDTGTSSGSYKYDVIYEGTLDENNGYDLSETAYQAILRWIQQGRGYLIGHDCFADYNTNRMPVRNRLAPYANMKVEYFDKVKDGDGTSIRVSKNGLLTNFPWHIGDIGTNLTVPATHTLSQYAYGDIWMRFNTGDNTGDIPRNFYLTTWNNCAMIQTGHSHGQLTDDEQKIIANTLFYLKQWTTATSTTDHSAQDQRAPNAPQLVSATTQGSQIQLSMTAQDNGSRYSYYVNVYNKNDVINPVKQTNTYTGVVATGVKGYYYVIDNSPQNNFDISSASYVAGSNILTPKSSNGKYLHVRAIDRAGNIGPVSNFAISVYQLRINPNQGVWNGSSNVQTLDLGKGQAITIAAPTRYAYTFTGWTLSRNRKYNEWNNIYNGNSRFNINSKLEINNT